MRYKTGGHHLDQSVEQSALRIDVGSNLLDVSEGISCAIIKGQCFVRLKDFVSKGALHEQP